MTRATKNDEGYFPLGTSLLREVHRQRAVGLLYGQRALGIGAINPLNFVGTRQHTKALDKPFQRLVHTAKAFETVYFGTRTEADHVLAFVHRLHERVEGELPEAAGPFAAGTRYSAFDPELMLWTVAVIADSGQAFYELFVRRLAPHEREALWRDYVRFGELFGMPRAAAPASYGEFREYWDDQLHGGRAHLTQEARHVAAAIMFQIPVPATHRLGMAVHNVVMLGALPPTVRDLYGLTWTPRHAVRFQAVVAAARATRPLTPAVVRTGWNTRPFTMVSDMERKLIARGDPVPGALV
jgi:uncharacterized protein (DUF2236 family)